MTTIVHPERASAMRSSSRSRRPVHGEQAPRLTCGTGEVLDRYVDRDGRRREVIERPGAAGSVLVIDRDATTLADRRLVAHLACDEPSRNAAVACALYMASPDASACRRLHAADLRCAPAPELQALAAEPLPLTPRGAWHGGAEGGDQADPMRAAAIALTAADGQRFALELRFTGMSIPVLRWCKQSTAAPETRIVSLRDVVGGLESYEPARSLTARALAAHHLDPAVSVAVLAVELERLNASRTVLNRGLRGAVLARVERESLSMSEIALRCGRVKRDRRGIVSGETSWLARRIGIAPEAPGCAPTPWVHSEVLALIARTGLGISPREVELG